MYFTKEFYTTEWLSAADVFLKISENAERKDEAFYQSVYREAFDMFRGCELMNERFCDPIEELRKIDERVNEPDISDEERSERILHRELYVALNKRRIARGTFEPFDEELCRARFDARQRKFYDIFSCLPDAILSEIADLRVFVLGYASEAAIRLLRPYCAELRKFVKRVKQKARAETKKAQKRLSKKIDFNRLEKVPIFGIAKEGSDICLKTAAGEFRFVNASLIEGEGMSVFDCSETANAERPRSKIKAAELHRIGEEYEANFLVCDRYGDGAEVLWYLSVCGEDIRKTDD